MPAVAELTAVYENFLLAPRAGPGVCQTCFNFTRGYERCYACTHLPAYLDTVVPISYSVAREQLHHALSCYKRLEGKAARRMALELGAVLWRFLATHEHCIAGLLGIQEFDLVTTVPSSLRERDDRHPLRWLVGEIVVPARERHERLLLRSALDVAPREFHAAKFIPLRRLHGRSVLLIDDTWTTGANAQSAATALKAAGAEAVAAVVIGRHLNREWHENDHRLRGIRRPFDWATCVVCGQDR